MQQLRADGGTEMRPALELALSTPAQESHLRQIVFITDGSVGYEDEMFSMIEQNLGDARLFTVGIGSAPNSWFMRKAAEAGRGTYTFISALHEVSEKMEALFRKLEHPQVTDITLHWPSGVIVDSYPAFVPDLYLGEPVSVRARASKRISSWRRPARHRQFGRRRLGGRPVAEIRPRRAKASARCGRVPASAS